INAKDNEGETPLHWLLKSTTASTAVLELLLENGADINAKDNSSQGPLYEAVNARNLAAVKILLERGVSINDQEDIFGRTALHVAVDAANLDMAMVLVEGGAEVDIRDKNGMTPLAIAAQKGLTQIVQCLLKTDKGLDLEYRGAGDSRERTGLHKSASRGHSEVVKLLLDTPDATALCNKPNEHGATPLHAAARRKDRHEIVKILIEKGAD
ncbi:ankyrin, partial [Wilcoxina mikolae CBS 423.85]